MRHDSVLVDHAGSSSGYHLSVIENGGVNVTFSSLVALAVAYKVSLSVFFEGTPVPR